MAFSRRDRSARMCRPGCPAPPVDQGGSRFMSPSTPPAAGQAMRQQLDELDALLQRMLTLPINQTEDHDPHPEPPTPRRATAEPTPAATKAPTASPAPART